MENVEVQDTNPAEGQEPEATITETPSQAAAESVNDLPDWAQKLIKDTRSEAAKYRKSVQEAETAAKAAEEAKLAEQGEFKALYEKAQAELAQAQEAAKAAQLSQLRTQIGTKHSLPQALIDRLQGEDAETIEADALSLLEAIPQSKPVLSTDSAAGTNGNPTPQYTAEDITRMANRYGLSEKALKQSLGVS